MKVLVTGASGFLGQHLCAALCDDFEVTGTFGSPIRLPKTSKVAAGLDLRDAAATSAGRCRRARRRRAPRRA